MKFIIGIVLALFCTLSSAQNSSLNLSIPSAPGNYQSDRFRSGELDCSMAIGSGVNMEFGVVGVIGTANPQTVTTDIYASKTKDVGVYGRMTIPIGMPKGRVDCSILYNMELEKKRIEIEKLQAELQNLKTMKFEK